MVIQGTSFWQTCLESVYPEGLIWMKVKACSVNLLSWSSALTTLTLSCSSGQEKEQGSDVPGWTPGSAFRSSETLRQLLNVSEFQFLNLSNSINKSLAWENNNINNNTSLLGCIQFSSVQSLSHVQLFASPWTAVRQASLSITNSQSLPKLMSIESVMPSNHLILYRSLLLLPSIFTSIRVFSNESVLPIRWPKYWSFSFSISPTNEYSGLISFRMDCLDLLESLQGTLKSLLQTIVQKH